MRSYALAPVVAAVVFLAASRNAYAVNLAISVGVRETGTTAAIGADGGSSNSIEHVNRDGLTLNLDGAFQTFTFTFGTDPVAFFFGTQPSGGAPNRLDGTRGVLEHLRIRNIEGITVPVLLHIDYIRNTTQQGTFTVSDFEGFAIGTEVTFQEPSFSGSTSANLALSPDAASVTNSAASQGVNSYGVQFRFIDSSPTRWIRLTTFGVPNLPNPTIEFAPGDTLSFDMRGVLVPEPAAAGLIGIGLLGGLRRVRRAR